MPFKLLQSAIDYVQANPERFNDALTQHFQLSVSAIGIAVLLAFPLGVLWYRNSLFLSVGMPLLSGFRVIPGLAVLALMIPLLGTGQKPALLALVILAVPPILMNTVLGLSQASPEMEEAALGLGMRQWEVFRRVILPLGLPTMITGLRTAVVEVVAGATLAALIGGGGMGVFIINGLSMYNFSLLLVGTLPVAAMALLAEIGLGRLEHQLTRYRVC